MCLEILPIYRDETVKWVQTSLTARADIFATEFVLPMIQCYAMIFRGYQELVTTLKQIQGKHLHVRHES